MPRKNDYISDNLITIRDRLRESAASLRENAGENVPATPAVKPAEAPKPGNTRRQEDGMRARQDLANRLAQDLARVTVQLEEAEQRTAQMRDRKKELEELARRTEELTPETAQDRFAAEADRLRLEYFRIRGRQDALQNGVSPAAENAAGGQREILKAAWIIAGAILTGTALTAGVIAVVFL